MAIDGSRLVPCMESDLLVAREARHARIIELALDERLRWILEVSAAVIRLAASVGAVEDNRM